MVFSILFLIWVGGVSFKILYSLWIAFYYILLILFKIYISSVLNM